ncbi:MAG TPA: adenosylcobalamin-dependent ribonucleoside-diphosphate reductase [Acidocella sp.]|nr:adenosylcobalamin-dependent ribonucleoside-diphosphate reductase [Acidocella sp.]
MAQDECFTPIAAHVWRRRYRQERAQESSIGVTQRRVARALAQAEATDGKDWERRFQKILEDFSFLPGGRILAGAGTQNNVTLLNCFVMGMIEDSVPGILRALEEGAATMRNGGGIGYDFSTIRPRDVRNPGPVAFMEVWDAMCADIRATGARRGAMMATLRCDHPDITTFIDSKRQSGDLSHFNLSVQITDAFMQAKANDAPWPLVFPGVRREIPARALWDKLLRASFDSGDPGVLFIDRINTLNNLYYCERITATNPCGEVPLPPYGGCDLGSINLPRLILDPFTPRARLDEERLVVVARIAVRLLDNAIDVSKFPLAAQQAAVRHARRIGLGITGLADALIMLGLSYGSDEGIAFASQTMRMICHAAYRASIDIAKEKGSFPAFSREPYLDAPFIRGLPSDIQEGIARFGIRNSHLLAIAPTGTISLLAGNVSSGIEPIFAADATRQVLEPNGILTEFQVTDSAVAFWRRQQGRLHGVPAAFVTAAELTVNSHLAMQAALQLYVDNAISKTINMPENIDFSEFAQVFDKAYDLGLKGCTVFRARPGRSSVLASASGSGA